MSTPPIGWIVRAYRQHARRYPHLPYPPARVFFAHWRRLQRAKELRQRDRARKAVQAAQEAGRPHLVAVR